MKMITKDWIRDYVKDNFKHITRENITTVLERHNVKVKKALKKDEMIKLINTNKIDLFEFIEFLGFTRKDLKDIFFATDKMIKKMQDTNFIKIKKTIRVEMPSAFGKVDMYLYDIETIYKITMAKYNKWLKENNYI
ncbi:MAG: hypothetical protein ACLR02_12870 [Clostridium sp.]|nr:hypothetical protein [Clostridium sp.]